MRIRILDSAVEDLDRGRLFYDRQGEGLGEYFIDRTVSGRPDPWAFQDNFRRA